MNNRMMISKAAEKDGYYLDGHFVLKGNWEISKHRFSKEAQKAFEEFVINKKA